MSTSQWNWLTSYLLLSGNWIWCVIVIKIHLICKFTLSTLLYGLLFDLYQRIKLLFFGRTLLVCSVCGFVSFVWIRTHVWHLRGRVSIDLFYLSFTVCPFDINVFNVYGYQQWRRYIPGEFLLNLFVLGDYPSYMVLKLSVLSPLLIICSFF